MLQNIQAHTSRYYKNHPKVAKDKPPRLLLYCKRTKNACRGVMLISVCQGSSADAIRFSLALQYKLQTSFRWRARMLFGCFRRLLRVRSFASLPAVRLVRCKGCAFCLRSLLLFARGCACVRLHAVWCCLFAVCAAFIAFAILCPPCTLSRVLWLVLYCSRVYCSLFCAPPVRRINARRGKGWKQGGQKPPASVGAFYSLRSPSASRCSFSATR